MLSERLTFNKSDVLNRQKRKTALAGGGFKYQKMQESLVSHIDVAESKSRY
jgi:hypothetical protein